MKQEIKLNLGCGFRHQNGFINIDNREEAIPDLLCDVAAGLPFEDSSVSYVRAFDFIEHLERFEVLRLIDEIYRVLKPGGIFEHFTPSDRGMGAWQDPHHKSAWNFNTWKFYFVDPDYRNLYSTKPNFKILKLEDIETDKNNMIIHTHCVYEAIK